MEIVPFMPTQLGGFPRGEGMKGQFSSCRGGRNSIEVLTYMTFKMRIRYKNFKKSAMK